MEKKTFFNSPLFKDIMVMPLNGRSHYALSHVIEALYLGSETDVLNNFCRDATTRLGSNNYITERDFMRLVLLSSRPEVLRFKLNLLDNVMPNLSLCESEFDDSAIVNICGDDIYQYFISRGQLDELISYGGVWLKSEYKRFKQIFPSSDSNVTRARCKFEDGLRNLLDLLHYRYEEQRIKGGRFLRILSDE